MPYLSLLSYRILSSALASRLRQDPLFFWKLPLEGPVPTWQGYNFAHRCQQYNHIAMHSHTPALIKELHKLNNGGGVSISQSDFMFYKRLQHEILLLSKHSSAFQVLIDLHTTTQEYICSEWIIHYASKSSYHLLTTYYVPCTLYTHFHLFIKTWQKGLLFPILKWK